MVNVITWRVGKLDIWSMLSVFNSSLSLLGEVVLWREVKVVLWNEVKMVFSSEMKVVLWSEVLWCEVVLWREVEVVLWSEVVLWREVVPWSKAYPLGLDWMLVLKDDYGFGAVVCERAPVSQYL